MLFRSRFGLGAARYGEVARQAHVIFQEVADAARIGVGGNDPEAGGIRLFLEDDMGLPCHFAISRCAGTKSDNQHVREQIATNPPLIVFGSFNERMYMAETNCRGIYIPASFPGAVIRRHTGTPFMGYAGATYLVQEVCNALFDALFHIIPLARDLDQVEATPARIEREINWDEAAKAGLDELVEREPVLVRISVAKAIRDAAERAARRAGETSVSAERLSMAVRDRKSVV